MNPEKPYSDNPREQKWQDALKGVDQLADKLGLGVDEGIKETVAAFHVFDINTTASHEGKIDLYPIPYIDVQSPDIGDLAKKLARLEDNEESELEAVLIHKEILTSNLNERKKIIHLLEEFYAERKVPYEVRLGIDSMARGWSRIQSQGAEFQEIENDENVRKQRLEQFQEEMRAFTDFLKNKYFNKG